MSARLGVTLDAQSADGIRAEANLEDASALIRSVAGMDWTEADSGDSGFALSEVPDIVKSITIAAAIRAFRNPGGASQASVGDVSISFSGKSDESAVFLTKQEAAAVRKVAGKSSVGSVDLETGILPGRGSRDPLFAPVEGGGDPIPIGPLPFDL